MLRTNNEKRWGVGRRIDEPEALAVALFAGLLCHFAPALIAVALASAVAMLHLREDRTRAHLSRLGVLAIITVGGLVGGPTWVIGSALCWRIGCELGARGGSWHMAAAPIAALLFRLDAPAALLIAASCAALIAWTDWAIARLAEWRLDAPTDATPFLGAQAALVVPLMALPSPDAALAAFVATALLRAAPPIAQPVRYALA